MLLSIIPATSLRPRRVAVALSMLMCVGGGGWLSGCGNAAHTHRGSGTRGDDHAATETQRPDLAGTSNGRRRRILVLHCAQRVEPAGPRPAAAELREARKASVILPAITFWGLREARNASALVQSDVPGGDAVWKSGVTVRSGRPVTVRVTRADQDFVALDYGRSGGGRQRITAGDGWAEVRFVPCPPDTPSFSSERPVGGETGFAGGFLIARRGCATLLIRRAGVLGWTPLRVGLGTPCR